jgi:hypothetical protein
MKNFKKYDTEHPAIWKLFVKFAMEAKYEKKFKHYSAKGIFELIRWHTGAQGNDQYKINNNFHAHYARKFNENFKGCKGV